MRKSKKRIEMGEEAWEKYQIQRKRIKANNFTSKNPDKVKKMNDRITLFRNKKKRLLVEYKGGECEHCHFKTDIMSVYDFHHKDPNEKDFGISSRSGYCKSLNLSKLEVDKCLLLCRNCHAIEHDRLFKETKEN